MTMDIFSDQYLSKAKQVFMSVKSKGDLDKAKAEYLGNNSDVIKGFSEISKSQPSERAKLGKKLNLLKSELEAYYRKSRGLLEDNSTELELLDLSIPSKVKTGLTYGHKHPTSQVLSETYAIFRELGFSIVDSDELETDWYNFEALNMPKDHPAREMQDTFYLDNGKNNLVPRTHTSGTQVRFMENNKPPLKIIVPGRVFRNEDEDATHIWSFYQIEGLVVGENISMSDLKGTLLRVIQGLLGPEADIRFRASYFPYTEPSVELDCKYKGKWLELGGAGMVHPQVLRNGGIDPEKYNGFAFGWGAERIANIKYGLTDLRELWRPRFEFLEQF